MIKKYVKIESVEDIDISKISLNNINHRYIDEEGNRYATRFNIRKRNIEIIRIALGNDEALKARNKEIKLPDKKYQKSKEQSENSDSKKVPIWTKNFNEEPEKGIDAKSHTYHIETKSANIIERFKGLISNIKKSDVFTRKQKNGETFLMSISHFLDHKIIDYINQVQNLCTEFTRFPQNNNCYMNMIEYKCRESVLQLSPKDQMVYFTASLVSEPYLEALKNGQELIKKVEEESSYAKKNKIVQEKQVYLNNAVQSLRFTEEELKKEIKKTLGWLKSAKVI